MNRQSKIQSLRNAGFESSYILNEMTKWFSEDDIEKFYKDFVQIHDVTLEEEDEEEELLTLADIVAQRLKEEEESQKITDEEREEISKKMKIALAKWEEIKSP